MPPEMLERLAHELANCGVTRWVLQPFRTHGCADYALNQAAAGGAAIDDALLARIRAIVPETVVRN
jgi:hypothetical protein